MVIPRGQEGHIFLEPTSFGGEGLVEAGKWCLFSCGEGCIDLEAVHRDVLRSVTEITMMFTERALFYPEYATSKQVQMYRYLSMIKTKIHEFLSTQQYSSLFELHSFARRREIENETQEREKRHTPVQTQPTVKRFKHADS